MTFPLQKPAGWVDGDAITDSQITNIDANLSNAIDGNIGGAYSPQSVLRIGGVGLDLPNCVNHVVTGGYALIGTRASISYRVDRVTVDPVATPDVTIDVASDIYIAASAVIAPVFANVGLNIDGAGKVPPSDGNIILVRKFADIADNNRMIFRQNSPSNPAYIGFLPGVSVAVGSPPQSNSYIWAEFVFLADAQRWEVLNCHSQFVFP